MLQKISIVTIVVSALLCSQESSTISAAIPAIAPGLQLTINGKVIHSDYAGYIIRATQTAYVPIRFVSEELGGTVQWNKANKQLTIHSKDNKTIILTIDSKIAYINGEEHLLTDAPQMTTPRVMVPIRFVSEALGAQVNVFKDANDIETVEITT